MKLSEEEEAELQRLLARFPPTRAGEREFVLALHALAVQAREYVRFYLDLSGYALGRIEVCAIQGAKAPDPGPVGAVIEWRLIRHYESTVALSLAEVCALKAMQSLLYAARAEDHGTRVQNVLDAIEHWRQAEVSDCERRFVSASSTGTNSGGVAAFEAGERIFRCAAGLLAGHAETAIVEALRG